MMKGLFAGGMMLTWAVLAQAYGAPGADVDAAVPDGFAIPRATGASSHYVFARITGTAKHMIDRQSIEAICDMQRKINPGLPVPRFDAGWDEPDRLDAFRFSNPARSVQFTIRQTYACVNQPSLAPANKICGCEYRRSEFRTTHYRRLTDKSQVEDVFIDHHTRQVRRSIRPGSAPMTSLEEGMALGAALAPTVTGNETIAGIPCEVRRREMGAGNYLEWCITPNDAKRVPDERLRGRGLRHRKVATGEVEIASERTLNVVSDVQLDDAAFAIPAGYAIQGMPIAPPR